MGKTTGMSFPLKGVEVWNDVTWREAARRGLNYQEMKVLLKLEW